MLRGEMMRALLCEAYGSPEQLRVGDAPLPEPAEGEVRIRVHAAGLNFPDALIIQDKYQVKPTLPFSPGGEAAGVIDKIGRSVTTLKIGDRVAALTTYGSFAQYVVAKANATMIVPDCMDMRTAAGFTLTYATSHYALKHRGNLRAGETVLILGAAGGVGLAAVELAKAMGAKVIAAASTDEKLALARRFGADEGINYSTDNLRSALSKLTDGVGIDVVLDPVGGPLAEPAFRSLAWGGRHLVIGFAGGNIPSLPLNLPLLKGASLVGVYWGEFAAREPALHARNMEELFRLYSEGVLHPHISRSYPLDTGTEAIRWMMDRKALGKVIITVE
jgi:NADPH2:quinone reductase